MDQLVEQSLRAQVVDRNSRQRIEVSDFYHAAEYVGELLKAKLHYLYELAVVDDADATFLGDGTKRTLKAAGEFIAKYGQAVYDATRSQYGCSDRDIVPGGLRAGTKPGATHDDDGGKKPPPAGSTSNPWASNFHGTTEERHAKIESIMKQGTKGATEMAKAAGTTVLRPLLR